MSCRVRCHSVLRSPAVAVTDVPRTMPGKGWCVATRNAFTFWIPLTSAFYFDAYVISEVESHLARRY